MPDGEVGEIVVTGPAMARGCLPGIRRTVRRCWPGGLGETVSGRGRSVAEAFFDGFHEGVDYAVG